MTRIIICSKLEKPGVNISRISGSRTSEGDEERETRSPRRDAECPPYPSRISCIVLQIPCPHNHSDTHARGRESLNLTPHAQAACPSAASGDTMRLQIPVGGKRKKMNETLEKREADMAPNTFSDVIPVLTEPFVKTGICASQEQALKHVILDYVERQIAWAESELRRYEQKHQKGFAAWSKSLVGRATVEDEDEWMEWEATTDMLEGWHQIKATLEQSDV